MARMFLDEEFILNLYFPVQTRKHRAAIPHLKWAPKLTSFLSYSLFLHRFLRLEISIRGVGKPVNLYKKYR
jgi:hypothetical protein